MSVLLLRVALALALAMPCTVSVNASEQSGLPGRLMAMRVRDVQTGVHGWAGLTELQPAGCDDRFLGRPPASTMASGGPVSLAQMYREQLGRRGAVCMQRMTPAWIVKGL